MPRRRYGSGGYRREFDRADDRGYSERASDEVRSWFGDDDAARRRREDQRREHEREWRGSDRGEAPWQTRYWRFGGYAPEAPGYPDLEAERRRREDQRHDRERDWRNWERGPWGQRQQYGEYSAADAPYDPEWSSRDREWREYDRDRERYRENIGGGWGRGPKGYQRSDTRINEDVCDRLTYSDVDASDVEVRVSSGEVTLSGTVMTRWDKRQAEDLVENVAGVREVHNNLRVSPQGAMDATLPSASRETPS